MLKAVIIIALQWHFDVIYFIWSYVARHQGNNAGAVVIKIVQTHFLTTTLHDGMTHKMLLLLVSTIQ